MKTAFARSHAEVDAYHPGVAVLKPRPAETSAERLARCEREFLELALKRQLGDDIPSGVSLRGLAVSITVQRAAISG